jgi:hypothetical protein
MIRDVAEACAIAAMIIGAFGYSIRRFVSD